MLILTRYNNQRIVVIAPDKSELWVTADDGLLIIVGHPKETHCITPNNQSEIELSGQKIVVTYLETRGITKPQHRIGIDAPKDYLILREELLNQPQKEAKP